jgi:hypothetical protein
MHDEYNRLLHKTIFSAAEIASALQNEIKSFILTRWYFMHGIQINIRLSAHG